MDSIATFVEKLIHKGMATKTNNIGVFLPLKGVESEHDALIADRGLSKLQGLHTHTVELNNGRAVIAAGVLYPINGFFIEPNNCGCCCGFNPPFLVLNS